MTARINYRRDFEFPGPIEPRGRGVARTAVYTVCREAIREKGVERLLLQADHTSAAERIYGQIGFRCVAQLLGLLKTP